MSCAPMQDATTPLLSNVEVAEDFYLARLALPSLSAAVLPGQFVQVRVSSRLSPFLRIPLSVCGVDRKAGTVDLLYEDMGPKSRALSRLKPGSRIGCLGPLGRGFTAPRRGCRAVLVGGGIGVPPLLFLGAVLQSENCPVTLLAGARSRSKHLPGAMLDGTADEVIMATDDGSVGHRGVVTDLLERTIDERGRCAVYTCGPRAMMAAVAAICRRRGILCQASLEEYMACGFGVCVGCVVRMAAADGECRSPYERYGRICVDGPVFDATGVSWDG